MKWFAGRFIFVGFCLAVAALLVAMWFDHQIMARLDANQERVTHTLEVLDQLDLLRANLVEVESSARGFGFSGSDRHLVQYRESEPNVELLLAALAEKLADNPVQFQRLQKLTAAARRKVQHVDSMIEARRRGDAFGVATIVKSGVGLELMNEVRSLVDAMRTEELRLLAERTSQVREASNWTSYFTLATNFTALGMFGIAAAVVARELRRRRQLQLELALSTAGLQAVLNSAADFAIIATDLEGKIDLFSVGAERLLGYRAADLIGRETPLIFFPESDLAKRAKALSAELQRPIAGVETIFARVRDGATDERECRYLTQDGRHVPVQAVWTARRTSEGELSGFVSVAYDISESKEAAAAMREARDAADRANKAKSEFLANMSHEIRTPMNAVIGMTELLLETPLSQEQFEYATTVHESAEALLRLLNDILDFSKIEAGKLELEAVELSLRRTLGLALKRLAVRAHQKNLELAFDVAPDCEDRLIGDPGRLQQIVINLVNNAIKFTEEGEVVVQVATRPLAVEPSSSSFAAADDAERTGAEPLRAELVITVRDTGIGIPLEQQETIFKAFTQVDSSTTRRFGGTGLGLSISAQLVRMMHGRIEVDSLPGAGSTFRVYLPIEYLPATSSIHDAPTRDWTCVQNRRVLVVDDNATNRQILAQHLKSWALEATLVEDGPAALAALEAAALQHRPFDLVLLDALMPEMDGFSVAEAIRQHPLLQSSVVMMLSSAGRILSGEQLNQIGIRTYLTKPVSPSDLLDAIIAALETEPAAQPTSASRMAVGNSPRQLKILLAEDTEENRRLAIRLLEKRGHQVLVAVNGREAVEAFLREPFDLILMDVQMPEMDGLSATQEIRRLEIERGLAPLPIVAMTAHAMQGDRERCLEAGMSGYLTKPLRIREFFEVLEEQAERFLRTEANLPAGSHRPAEIAPPPVVESPAVFDRVQALDLFDNDESMLLDMAETFLRNVAGSAAALKTAVETRDAAALRFAAHRLKGQVSMFAAANARELAGILEGLGKEQRLDEIDPVYEKLDRELALLVDALQQLVKSAAEPAQ